MAREATARDLETVPLSELDALVAERIAAEVAKRTDEITATVMANLAAMPKGAVASPVGEDWGQALAMAIAQLTDQGSGKKRVAPEVVAAREAAKERMFDLIHTAHAEGRDAEYQLRAPVVLDEVFVSPLYVDQYHRQQPTRIVWPGPPNEAMEPINDTAKAIYAEFATWIGTTEKRDFGSFKTTPRGLAIVSRAMPAPEAAHTAVPGSAGGGLRVTGRGDAGMHKDVRILGTIAKPATQQV